MAPIVIFGFNRAESLRATLESLAANPEASESDLFIFIDGPRNEEEKSLTDETIRVANKTTGFKSVTVKSSPSNRGLGDSIISGVTEVINQYGKAIVLEDDLRLQPNFLAFINQGLNRYENDPKIFSICGYTSKVKPPKNYAYDAYLCTRSSSWGWATWKDRWETVDWSGGITVNQQPETSHQPPATSHQHPTTSHQLSFNAWGGSDCEGMLEGWRKGRNKSWAIRFCYSQYLQDRLSVFPVKSLLENEGFDGTGTNCKKWSRFKYELMNPDKREFSFPEDSVMLKKFHREALKYHSIPRRILSRIMYMVYK